MAASLPLQVFSDRALDVGRNGAAQVVVKVTSGDTVYYADQPFVTSSSNQGSLTNGQSATFSTDVWLKSASQSTVTATQQGIGPGATDVVIGSDGTVGGAGGTPLTSTTVTSARQVLTGTGLTGGGDLTADRTLAVASSVVNAGADTLITTKGDLTPGTGNGTRARRAVGSDGQVLTADSTQTDGVKWAAASSVPAGSIWGPAYAAATTAQSVANDYYAIRVWIPAATQITGIALGGNIGTGGGNVIVGLCDSTGARVASSGTVALTNANNQQQVPFTVAYTPTAGVFYIEIIISSATASVARAWTTAPVTNTAPQAALPGTPITPPTFNANGRAPYVSTY